MTEQMRQTPRSQTPRSHAPWSQIQSTDLWRRARAAYDANGFAYHNFDHVLRLYEHAARIGLSYSRRLDENILAHDVIMDLGPVLNERASAHWLLDAAGRGDNPRWADPILGTIEHRPSGILPSGDAWLENGVLAMLDLMDFCCAETSRRNTAALLTEAMQQHSDRMSASVGSVGSVVASEIASASGSAAPKIAAFDQTAWAQRTCGYLSGLSSRIQQDLCRVNLEAARVHWLRIDAGINATIRSMNLEYVRETLV